MTAKPPSQALSPKAKTVLQTLKDNKKLVKQMLKKKGRKNDRD